MKLTKKISSGWTNTKATKKNYEGIYDFFFEKL